MRINVSTYISGQSCIHACDARVKLLLLAAYSVTLFLVHTWWGLALCAVAFIAVMFASGIPAHRFLGIIVPVYVLVAFTIVFNAFALDVWQAASAGAPGGLGAVSAGVFASFEPVAFVGSFGFVPAGFARGCFFAVRIILLVLASLVITYTTVSTDLTAALNDFLSPLKRLHVPVDDVATVFSLALRFIPVTAEEFGRIHDAQWTRGASFGTGNIWQRLCAWQTVLIPLFVGLFRRADALAVAMDARCYGVPDVQRTSLTSRAFTLRSAFILVVGLMACVALAVWL